MTYSVHSGVLSSQLTGLPDVLAAPVSRDRVALTSSRAVSNDSGAGGTDLADALVGGGGELADRTVGRCCGRDNICTRLTERIAGAANAVGYSIAAAATAAAGTAVGYGGTVLSWASGFAWASGQTPPARVSGEVVSQNADAGESIADDFVMVADAIPSDAAPADGAGGKAPALADDVVQFFGGLDEAVDSGGQSSAVFARLVRDGDGSERIAGEPHGFLSGLFRRFVSWLPWSSSGNENSRTREIVGGKLRDAVAGLDETLAGLPAIKARIDALAAPSRAPVDLLAVSRLYTDIRGLHEETAISSKWHREQAVRHHQLATLAEGLAPVRQQPKFGSQPLMTWELERRFDCGDLEQLTADERENMVKVQRGHVQRQFEDYVLAHAGGSDKFRPRFSCAWGGEGAPDGVCAWEASENALRVVTRGTYKVSFLPISLELQAELRFEGNQVALYPHLPSGMDWVAKKYLNTPRLQEVVAEILRDAGLPVS